MPEVVLTIGGSDSGGGAGIQADIKTFSALGLHGTSALTAITAQNTLGVQHIYPLPQELVRAQMQSITDDFSVAWAKTGMLHSAKIVDVVADHLQANGIPLVLDPVIEAEAGGRLLQPDAVSALKDRLLPLADVVTPNIFEAEALTGIAVRDMEGAARAARGIMSMGARAVIVKGGHLDCTDLVADGDKITKLPSERVKGQNHGIGCTFSAALTSFLAQGWSLEDSARKAKEFAKNALRGSFCLGGGAGPVNQAWNLREEASRYQVIYDLQRAADILKRNEGFIELIPEGGSIPAQAKPDPRSPDDVAEVEGGLREFQNRICQVGGIKFGCGSWTASLVLAAIKIDPKARAALNLAPRALAPCRDIGLWIIDRDQFDKLERELLIRSTVRCSDQSSIRCSDQRSSEEISSLKNGRERRGSTFPDAIWVEGSRENDGQIVLLGPSATFLAHLAAKLAGGQDER